MSVLVVLLTALAGGAGAAARFLVDGAVRERVGGTFPLGILLINVTGSFFLGVLAGLALRGDLAQGAHVVAGTGFLGGFTTFSTASLDTVRLIRSGNYLAALAYALGTAGAALAAAAVGLAVVLAL
ncbi:fluoride efflux transporter CrcB [Arthrobacter sp. Br18]|uniref:fluoride efflux transporter CrcB n=1 Tax=Arthrobacter sp. Br18 TaxID=1312954 RepID=UPI00047C7D07|nr:fluoride efflux transporter CrcB [Arthrobacter sp. Br18]